jgi:excisionase family DNA binding protein
MDNNLLDFANQFLVELEKTVRDVAKEEIGKHFDLLNKKEESDNLLTVDDAAQYLDVSIPTIYRYKSKGKLPFSKNGNKVYFFKKDLYDFIHRKKISSLEELSKIADLKFNYLNNKSKNYGY